MTSVELTDEDYRAFIAWSPETPLTEANETCLLHDRPLVVRASVLEKHSGGTVYTLYCLMHCPECNGRIVGLGTTLEVYVTLRRTTQVRREIHALLQERLADLRREVLLAFYRNIRTGWLFYDRVLETLPTEGRYTTIDQVEAGMRALYAGWTPYALTEEA